MNNNYNRVLIAVMAVTATAAIGFGLAQAAKAYRGDPAVKGPNYSEERHAAMEKAFETKDYKAWKELSQNRGRAASVVTADNFARFAEAHELAEDGKYAEADAIRKELGLRTRDGMRAEDGSGQGRGYGRHGNR
ncbi:MAG: hypothetical protein WBP40_03435 [Candidatus Moraniibacteriota bacterium]